MLNSAWWKPSAVSQSKENLVTATMEKSKASTNINEKDVNFVTTEISISPQEQLKWRVWSNFSTSPIHPLPRLSDDSHPLPLFGSGAYFLLTSIMQSTEAIIFEKVIRIDVNTLNKKIYMRFNLSDAESMKAMWSTSLWSNNVWNMDSFWLTFQIEGCRHTTGITEASDLPLIWFWLLNELAVS